MQVKLTTPVRVGEDVHPVGDVLDLAAPVCEVLIARRRAEAHHEPEPAEVENLADEPGEVP